MRKNSTGVTQMVLEVWLKAKILDNKNQNKQVQSVRAQDINVHMANFAQYGKTSKLRYKC